MEDEDHNVIHDHSDDDNATHLDDDDDLDENNTALDGSTNQFG